MGVSASPTGLPTDRSSYERWSDRLTDWCPYVTLAMSSILVLAFSEESVAERIVTAALVAIAALWVYFGYTRAPQPRREHRLWMGLYFIGLLAIGQTLVVLLACGAGFFVHRCRRRFARRRLDALDA